MTVSEPTKAHDFYVGLGMRSIMVESDIAITELRGGTHLLFQRGDPGAPGDAPFDLMVDDLESTHEAWRRAGYDVSDILPGDIHSVFVLTDPDGYRTIIYDSHVEGAV